MTGTARKIDLTELRAGVDRIGRKNGTDDVLPLGLPAVDGLLPGGGLALGALHEVVSASDDAAGLGFILALAACCRQKLGGAVLWCQSDLQDRETGHVYGPGLAQFEPGSMPLLVARVARPVDALWTMEEALRAGTVAVVVGIGLTADLVTSRRLHLAARARGRLALLLSPGREGTLAPSVAVTRWAVASAPTTGPAEDPRWHVTLRRSRGGGGLGPNWYMRWNPARSIFVPG